MQNYVDPKVMSKLFLKHGLITKGQLLGEEVLLQVQMNYMLGDIRKNIGLKNVEVFHSLLDCFKTVPEYNTLAKHLEGQSCMYISNGTNENYQNILMHHDQYDISIIKCSSKFFIYIAGLYLE